MAVFVGSGFDAGSLSGAVSGLKSQLPYFAKEFASSGVVAVGNAIGLDPRISGLISIPVSAGIGAGVSSLGAARSINSLSVMAAVKNGLAAGAESIGFNFSTQSANSLFGSLSVGNITSSIESSLGKEGLFSNILNLVKTAVMIPANAVSGVVRSALSSARGFNSLIHEKGIIGAFESLAASIFNRQTLEAVVEAGGMSGFMGSASKTAIIFDGEQAEQWSFGSTSDSSGLSLFFNAAGEMIGKKESGVTQSGTFGFTGGTWGLISGSIMALLTGGDVFAGSVMNGQLGNSSIFNAEGQKTADLTAEGGNGGPIIIDGREYPTSPDNDDNSDNSGSFWNFIFKLTQWGMSFKVKDGKAESAEVQSQSSNSSSEEDPNKSLYMLVNGVNNTDNIIGSGFNTPPRYYDALRDDLVVVDPTIDAGKDVAITSIYPNLKLDDNNWMQNTTIDDIARKKLRTFANRLKDVVSLRLEADVKAIPGFLVSSILSQAKAFGVSTRPIQALGYSGGFAPMLEALNWANSDVQMIVGVGAATLDLTRFRDVLGVTVSTLRSLLSERVLTQNSPDFINEAKTALSNFYNFAVTKIPFLGPAIGVLGSIISNIFSMGKSVIDMVLDATDKVFDIFSDLMEKIKVQALIDAQPLVGLTNLNGKAEGVLNIYGDKDLVADLGVGGYRPSIAGFTDKLINIEIKSQRGAISDHYTYMHNIRTPQDYAEMGADGNTYQHEFDDRVADFIAELLVVGKTPQDAEEFFGLARWQPYITKNNETGEYGFYPFGIAEGVS